MFQPAQWVTTQKITEIPSPFQQATGTPGRESTIQLKKKGSEAGSQVIRLSGSHTHKNKQTNKQTKNSNWKRSGLRVSWQAQLNPGCSSSVGKGRPPLPRHSTTYGSSLSLLTQPAIAEATCHNRDSPPVQRWANIAEAVLTKPI